MQSIGGKKQWVKSLITLVLGLSVVFGAGEGQAYFNGAPAYNPNYRPINGHMGYETYVDLSSINIMQNDNTWLVFNVLTATAKEDSDELRENNTALKYKVNKHTGEAWIANESGWKYLALNREPFGYETSSFNAVNMCYAHLYGEYLNDASGSAADMAAYYKGE